MAITIKSKVKDIFENNEAYAIIKKHIPGMDRDDARMKQALDMSMKSLLGFPGTKCPKDVREAIAEELESANIE